MTDDQKAQDQEVKLSGVTKFWIAAILVLVGMWLWGRFSGPTKQEICVTERIKQHLLSYGIEPTRRQVVDMAEDCVSGK